MVVFDANFLIFFLDPKVQGGAGTDVRIDHLVATIQNPVIASSCQHRH
jgi:hypothetical protein